MRSRCDLCQAALGVLLIMLLGNCLSAQTEAESSQNYLSVQPDSGRGKSRYAVNDGDRVRVQVEGQDKWVRGKVSAIADSSFHVGSQAVAVSQVRQLRGRTDAGTVWAGCLLFFMALGLGFLGWVFGRALLTKRPDNWWQWTLVALGALGVVILLPIALLTALVLWALSQHHYTLGKGLVLKVLKKNAS